MQCIGAFLNDSGTFRGHCVDDVPFTLPSIKYANQYTVTFVMKNLATPCKK